MLAWHRPGGSSMGLAVHLNSEAFNNSSLTSQALGLFVIDLSQLISRFANGAKQLINGAKQLIDPCLGRGIHGGSTRSNVRRIHSATAIGARWGDRECDIGGPVR